MVCSTCSQQRRSSTVEGILRAQRYCDVGIGLTVEPNNDHELVFCQRLPVLLTYLSATPVQCGVRMVVGDGDRSEGMLSRCTKG